MPARVFAIPTVIFALLQAAPVPQRLEGTVAITGRVVSTSGKAERPVRRAKVTLTGGAGTSLVTDTDAAGAYRFDRLPAAEYRVTVQKPGFLKLDVAALTGSTLTLDRAGAIEGTVADAVGDPLWDVVVRAIELQGDGRPRMIAEGRTNDLGRYRLHTLSPGDYYVEAATDRTGGTRPASDRAFHPAASAIENAKPVRVLLGRDTTDVDVLLTPAMPLRDPPKSPPSSRADAEATAGITGRVADVSSGKPIRNAQLQLLAVDGPRTGVLARTDAQGRFAFSSLRPGRYTLRAEAERFVSLEFGQKQPADAWTYIKLRQGEDFPADFKLPRANAVEGAILDEFGDPVPGITVTVGRKEYAAGRQRLMPVASRLPPQTTDDRGRYRISGLQPGDYYVAALSGAFAEATDVPGFARTYYPGTADSGAAVPVAVALGADGAASFSLIPAKTVSVSGTMLDEDGRALSNPGTLMLMTVDPVYGIDLNMVRTVTAPDGKFTLKNVPPGSYTVHGFAPPSAEWRGNVGNLPFGWQTITVGDADLEHVILTVRRGTALRGRIVLEDTAAVRPPSAGQIRVAAIPVEFESAPVGGLPPPSETRADLTFEVTALSGRRRIYVNIAVPGWALRRITRDDIDITDTAQDFRTKDVEGVDIVLTSKVSRVTGTVSDSKGRISHYAVVVFASDSTKWIDRSRFVAIARPTQEGGFEVRGLPPEDYLAIALPNVVGSEWQDPDFLHQLRSSAVSFALADGEAKVLELTLKKRP
jgi:protocatechuate 3,4-dioxygenase beta subunit